MEEVRLRDMLQRIQTSNIVITFPERLTPFCFPIKVDSMREDLSSEKLEDRVRKNAGAIGKLRVRKCKNADNTDYYDLLR